jgi:hypothetical protein
MCTHLLWKILHLSIVQKSVLGLGVVLCLPMCFFRFSSFCSWMQGWRLSISYQYVPSWWLKRIVMQTKNFTSTQLIIFSFHRSKNKRKKGLKRIELKVFFWEYEEKVAQSRKRNNVEVLKHYDCKFFTRNL